MALTPERAAVLGARIGRLSAPQAVAATRSLDASRANAAAGWAAATRREGRDKAAVRTCLEEGPSYLVIDRPRLRLDHFSLTEPHRPRSLLALGSWHGRA